MEHLGYICIKNTKIIFVYHELPKPVEENYTLRCSKNPKDLEWEFKYLEALEEYQASKREVEVSNEASMGSHIDIEPILNDDFIEVEGRIISFKNNQPCKAKVENEIAVITKIL